MRRGPSADNMTQNSKQTVSVIIPSYNEASYISRLLDALARQSLRPHEVIVSDAQSKDGIGEVIAAHQDTLPVRLVSSPPEGPGAGRNVGASRAQGDWLLFLDADDDLEDDDFIRTLLETTITRGWQTSSAKVVVRGASLAERFGTRANYLYTKLLAHTKHPVAPGWCILTRRNLFEENGGFNAKIQFGEDYDYVSRVGKHGFGFVDSTEYVMDLRRAREEGWRFVYKGFANEVYRHTHRYNLERNPIKYEFGKHQKRDK